MGLKKKTYVGLDLGHHTLKAIQIERAGGLWRILRLATIATPPDSIKDGVVIDAPAVGAAIKQMLRDGHINASGAHIAAAGGSVFVRPVPFPKMPEATLRKSIRFEASRYIPGSVEDSLVEFDVIGPIDDATMNVLIVAAPKDIVESRIQACREAGIEVESVDVEMFAAYRCLVEANQIDDWSERTLALIDIGAVSTGVSVIEQGVFAMTRVIPMGGQSLTDSLRNYFKLSQEDAESGKMQLNLVDLMTEQAAQENPPLRVLQPMVDDLLREIRRSLNYFQSQASDGTSPKAVDAVLLVGGGAKLPGLAAYLESKLGLTVHSHGVFDNPRFTMNGPIEDTGLDLSIASGLAMRAFTKAA